MSTLSVVVITCNEARYLPDCVASVRDVADEIVVCDMMSEDGSADRARDLGCRVITHPRRPAPDPEARTAVIRAATGDWVLAFDPDMRLPAATARRVREIVDRDEADVVDFHCANEYFGRVCRYGHGSQPVYRKLFRRDRFRPVDRNIHSFMHDSLSGRVLTLGRDTPIRHIAYETLDRCLDIHLRYARREAEQARAAGRTPSLARMLLAPAKRFLGNYFLRQGFRDGMPGLVVSAVVSGYLFLIEAYLWEMHRGERDAAPAPPASGTRDS